MAKIKRIVEMDEELYNTIMCTPNSPVLGWSEIAQSVPYDEAEIWKKSTEVVKKRLTYLGKPGKNMFDAILEKYDIDDITRNIGTILYDDIDYYGENDEKWSWFRDFINDVYNAAAKEASGEDKN